MRKTGQFIILKKKDKNKPITISWEPVEFLLSSDLFLLMTDLLDTLIESLARFWKVTYRQHIK